MDWKKPVEKKPADVEVEKIVLEAAPEKSVICLYCGAAYSPLRETCPDCATSQ